MNVIECTNTSRALKGFPLAAFMVVAKFTSCKNNAETTLELRGYKVKNIDNTSWKVLAYGIYERVVDVSEIERVSAANE